ncbi:Dolichyl-diphosphooligosaccharide-protein glycosyltransferase 48kDa subunit [Terfezia boudieri ATCC MYA-4762]|uniref:Dolichyl-diphosphooligosaccharide--protein glycosyltransferase subunit WBP1 n=1 Tax=Terfezia boudieri ATCC MYA-4762 TaxID=1051890 RepID=A0A3N4LWH4_9PEZI|nr:Dolichyl-diphosphooligosaccharide-protein glycosyltransferase 48kDa subunit [Terfezia boudieri ATCC MYA-4762]
MWFTRSTYSLFTSFLLVLLISQVCARSISGDRLLIIDEGELRNNYKAYIWDLEQRGFQLTYLSPKSPELELFSYGERKWDHLLLLPPKSKAYGPKLTSQLLVEFLNKDGNILVLQDPMNTPEQLRDLAWELEIGLAPKGDVVVDHFNWLPGVEGNDHSHNVILAKKPVTGPLTKNYFGGYNNQEEYVAFRGTGHTLRNSPLIQPFLQAPRTAYVYDPREETVKSENPWTAGQQLYLASGFQARNNARITFVGSAESFNDEFQGLDGLRKGPYGQKVNISNRRFANDVTAWTFKETGVVKVWSVAHYATKDAGNLSRRNTSESPSIYRIKTDVTFEITLSEYAMDRWIPFQLPLNDSLQLEFTMLDPYYRLNLVPTVTSVNSTTFSVNFIVPDQHGIFAFRINYKRPYITYIDEKIQVTLRHMAHNEWTRSYAISGSWVWLGGLASTVIGWVAFVALWLYSVPRETKVAAKKQ